MGYESRSHPRTRQGDRETEIQVVAAAIVVTQQDLREAAVMLVNETVRNALVKRRASEETPKSNIRHVHKIRLASEGEKRCASDDGGGDMFRR